MTDQVFVAVMIGMAVAWAAFMIGLDIYMFEIKDRPR